MPGSHLHTLEPNDKTKDLGVTAVSSDREVSTSSYRNSPVMWVKHLLLKVSASPYDVCKRSICLLNTNVVKHL